MRVGERAKTRICDPGQSKLYCQSTHTRLRRPSPPRRSFVDAAAGGGGGVGHLEGVRCGVRPVHAFGTCSCASGDTKVCGNRLTGWGGRALESSWEDRHSRGIDKLHLGRI